MKRFSWKLGRHYPVTAQKFGEWLETLPDKRPETLVKAARNPRAVGHKLFEWDPSRAAEQYRLIQARVIYGSLTVDVVLYDRKKPRTIQAQAIMHSTREGDYDSVDVAMSDPPKRDFVLAQAMMELQSTRRRYAHLSELAVIFSAMDRVAKKIKRKAA
jgi:hypothetical protein